MSDIPFTPPTHDTTTDALIATRATVLSDDDFDFTWKDALVACVVGIVLGCGLLILGAMFLALALETY